MSIIMRATLHDHAPNTYYGQWLAQNAGKHAAKPGAIARNELVARAGVATFDGAARDFPGIARWRVGNLSVDQKEKSARQAKWRDDHAAYRFYLKQQRSSFCRPERSEGPTRATEDPAEALDPSLRSG